MKDKKVLWAALAIVLVLGSLWQYFPLPDAKGRMDALPLSGSTFSGEDVALNSTEKTLFAGVNLIKRIYTIGAQKCFVTVLDGTRNKHVVHDPFYCFTGGGWHLEERRQIPLLKGSADLLVLSRDTQRKEVLVWFSDGQSRHSSALRYFIQTTLRRLTLGVSGPEPLLVVIQPYQATSLDWNAVIENLPPLKDL